ncbi:MAG: DUF427 domain-containing protein [Gemmobacter sp.]
MSDHIRIRRAEGTWVVRAGGAVLGESRNALELSEGDYPPVIYFPRTDIAMAFLEPSARTSTCPHKGQASYFTIVTKSGRLTDAVWSYETPHEPVARIAGHLAFYPDRVTVERV